MIGKLLKSYGFILLILMLSNHAIAQNAPGFPDRSLAAEATQELSFGDITLISGSAGGTVTVDINGNRNVTGSLVALNSSQRPVSPAIYEIKLCPGRLVTIHYPATVILNGSNGGTLTLTLGVTNLGASGASFVSNAGCDNVIKVYQGGSIAIGALAANPTGEYEGTFEISFDHQ